MRDNDGKLHSTTAVRRGRSAGPPPAPERPEPRVASEDDPERDLDSDEVGAVGKDRLTYRQRQVLQFISQSIRSRGYPPTLREIGQHMQIRSTNGVNDHLRALEKKGFLERHDLKSRALRVKTPDDEKGDDSESVSRAASHAMLTAAAALSEDVVEVPLLGRVAAGQPLLAFEQREDTVQVDRFFLGNHRDVFALRVKGDSMIEAGIHDGDYLFVKKQSVARAGDIVVAMINDEATVKYFYPERDRIVFKPANSRMVPIEVKKSEFKPVNLLGTVVGIYRRIT